MPLTLLSPDLSMNMLKETYTLVLKTLTSGVPEDDPIPPHPAHSAVAAEPQSLRFLFTPELDVCFF